MVKISVEGIPIDLPKDFGIEVEMTNPVFNDRGSQTIPVTVAATPLNSRLMLFPHRVDTARNPNAPELSAQVVCGSFMRNGTLNVTEASFKSGITFNIGFDNSTAYQKWQGKSFSELTSVEILETQEDNTLEGLMYYLQIIYKQSTGAIPIAIFPILVDRRTASSTETEGRDVTHQELLNPVNGTTLIAPTTLKRVIDNTLTEVTVPAGYGITPFLKVWKVLEIIFADLGVKILRNPFKTDPDLMRLCVLNNAADACCRGYVDCADLLPDCTVEKFLNALWVRFGLVCFVDSDRRTVDMALLRDIINAEATVDLTTYAMERGDVVWEAGEYISLEAATSLDGAEPATERFEDFIKGRDITDMPVGEAIDNWTLREDATTGESYWDGDISDDLREDPDPGGDETDPDVPDPDEPDPDDPYDQGGDQAYGDQGDIYYRAKAREGDSEKSFIARETDTGRWYLLDAVNHKKVKSSSPFFKWDPQPEGLEARELTSDDECVPIELVTYNPTGVEEPQQLHQYMPVWITGARHFHTYIAGAGNSEEINGDTPLSFVFAYNYEGVTYGRIMPEERKGEPKPLSDGVIPKVSLLFDTSNGLYHTFWEDYDRIIRTAGRYINLTVRMAAHRIADINMLEPVMYGGIKCLVDSVRYSLPSGREVCAEIKLRPLVPLVTTVEQA